MSVETPWRQSQKGSVYCKWDNLPHDDDIKSQLKQEDRFQKTIGEYRYSIKKNEDGSFIVFRSTKAEYELSKERQQQHYKKRLAYRITEVQILPIAEANKLLSSNDQFELVGADPIKVLNGQFFVVVGSKEKIQ
jgi:hypothetical protein